MTHPAPDLSGRNHRDAGFTLVEVIVALAILAIVLAMLPGAMRLGGRAFETTARLARDERHEAARALIAQRLAEAMPIETADLSDRLFSFRGDARTLSFVAPSASGPAGGGLHAYALAIERRPDGDALTLTQSVVGGARARLSGTGGGPTRPQAEQRTLLERQPALAFRYFGLARDDGARGWQPAWDGIGRLPELVEIVAEGPAHTAGSPFVTLTVALRLRPPG